MAKESKEVEFVPKKGDVYFTVLPIVAVNPTSHEQYSTTHGFDDESYTSSGVSLNLMYDLRDNAANPYKGRYFLGTYRYNPELLGSESSTIWLEYRDYFNLSGEEIPICELTLKQP